MKPVNVLGGCWFVSEGVFQSKICGVSLYNQCTANSLGSGSVGHKRVHTSWRVSHFVANFQRALLGLCVRDQQKNCEYLRRGRKIVCNLYQKHDFNMFVKNCHYNVRE